MIPLGDVSRRPTNFPIITLTIIVINAIVFILELTNGDAFVNRWSVIPANIAAGRDTITLLTAMFMHGSWSHILGNMVFLWAFGPEIEDAMGPSRYVLFYTIGGIAAMLAQIAIDPHSTVPNLGASGAIAAVMGGFLITYPGDQIRTLLLLWVFVRITYVPAALLIGFWFLIQLFSVGSVANSQTGGVAYVAHVGGFLFGTIAARFLEDPKRIAVQDVDDL
jgi:membrane associated rhomboid family serine protease